MLTLRDHSKEPLFVLVDAHSKWPYVDSISTTITSMAMDLLRQIWITKGHGDNDSQFTSGDFNIFMKQNGIPHIRSDC